MLEEKSWCRAFREQYRFYVIHTRIDSLSGCPRLKASHCWEADLCRSRRSVFQKMEVPTDHVTLDAPVPNAG